MNDDDVIIIGSTNFAIAFKYLFTSSLQTAGEKLYVSNPHCRNEINFDKLYTMVFVDLAIGKDRCIQLLRELKTLHRYVFYGDDDEVNDIEDKVKKKVRMVYKYPMKTLLNEIIDEDIKHKE